MKAARRRVLWVCTSQRTRGGVGSYARTLLVSPLGERWNIRHVVTHRDGSILTRILIFLAGAFHHVVGLLRRPALVHLHMASHGSFLRKALLALPAHLLRVPVILHVHGAEFHAFHEQAFAPLRWAIRTTLARSTRVVALGETWAERLRAIAPEAIVVVIPNAVDVPGEPAYPVVENELVQVVFLGRIDDRKGAFTLIDAWARSTVGTGAARLVLAGDGAVDRARARVDELGLGESVSVRNWLSAAEVAELLADSEVLALPSHDEGQPIAVLEAMAHGLCVVGSPAGGVPELLAGGCGIVVPAGEPSVLAEVLDRVISDRTLRTETGARARDRVRTTYDTAVVWRRLDSLYREVAS